MGICKYGLLTKCEVKMARYWPSFFLRVYGQYPAILTEQTWSIKDLLHGYWWNFTCGIQRVVPSGQDGSILPARVTNHSARFGSSCPLVVQSLNSPFFPFPIGAEPRRAKKRVHDNLHAHAQNEPIKYYQPRCSRQCVTQCLFQLALWKKAFSLTSVLW